MIDDDAPYANNYSPAVGNTRPGEENRQAANSPTIHAAQPAARKPTQFGKFVFRRPPIARNTGYLDAMASDLHI